MNRILPATLLLLLAAASPLAAQTGSDVPAPAGDAPPKSPGALLLEKLPIPPLGWKVPEVGREVERVVLPSGTILYMYEDHSLPVVNVQVRFRTGSLYEPVNGLASLTGTLLREGGTASRTPEEIDRTLEVKAISLSTGIGEEMATAGLDCMAKDLDEGLGLLADILLHPAFRDDILEFHKGQVIEGIRRRNDELSGITTRILNGILYGDHPYGREPEWKAVAGIRRGDLVAFHRKYFLPGNCMVGVTGDFRKDEFRKLWEKRFAGWEGRPVEFPPVPAVSPAPHPGAILVAKDVNQSSIRLGHLGIDWSNPDRHAVAVLNFILGGGSFTSRLTERVRNDEGLAYRVGSSYSERRDLGAFVANCQTKSATTAKAIRILRGEIEGIRTGGVTEEEVRTAKDALVNRYVFQFADRASVLSQLMDLEYFDRPRDLLARYMDDVRAVTVASVNEAAKKHLRPENLTLVVAGNPDRFDAPLDSLGFGEVTRRELEEPPPPLDQIFRKTSNPDRK